MCKLQQTAEARLPLCWPSVISSLLIALPLAIALFHDAGSPAVADDAVPYRYL
jgi:hypothetical protein